MSKKQIIVLTAVGVFVVIGVIVGILTRSGGETSPIEVGEEGNGDVANSLLEDESGERSVFTSEVPQGIEPTTPAIEAPAAPDSDVKFGIFNMTVGRNGYEPSIITVKQGNLVQIRLTALDGDYDFSMPYKGLYQFVKEGETRQISFGVKTSGTFAFECRDFCPDGKKITGELIVLP